MADVALFTLRKCGPQFSTWSVPKLVNTVVLGAFLCRSWMSGICRFLRQRVLTPQPIRTWENVLGSLGPELSKTYQSQIYRYNLLEVTYCVPTSGARRKSARWTDRLGGLQTVRMRGTYYRPQGSEHFLASYDAHDGYINAPRSVVWMRLATPSNDCGCYPRHRLYVVLDKLPLVHNHVHFPPPSQEAPRFISLSRPHRLPGSASLRHNSESSRDAR